MTTHGITGHATDQATAASWGTFEAAGLGTLWLAWTDKGLCQISFQRFDSPPGAQAEVPPRYAEPLARYFAGESEDFASVPLDLKGTEFQMRVWEALRTIPYGQVRTYGGIAADIGSPRGMRAVGMANHVNPVSIIVPCHRVVEAGHHLGGYGGGVGRKRFLLELEGARVQEGVVQPGQLELF